MDPPRAAAGVDERTAPDVGRRARLELTFAYRRGGTVLKYAYAEPPFHIRRPVDFGGEAQVILACSGPGVFAGDRLEQRIHVESGARVILISQSSLQVHPANAADPATIASNYIVDAGARLEAFWDSVIPFAAARLRQRISLCVVDGGELFWTDALMSGRTGRGEAWRFDTVDHELRLMIGGHLEYLERYRLAPHRRRLAKPWLAGDAHYIGTMLACGGEATRERAEQAHCAIAGLDNLFAAVDIVADRFVIGKLLSSHGPTFASARESLRSLFGRPRLRRL